MRPHAASVSSAPPVPSPTDHEEYSRLRGVHCTCIYVCIDCKPVCVCIVHVAYVQQLPCTCRLYSQASQ